MWLEFRRVLFRSPNFYQAIVAFLAANRIGAITTFLNIFSEIDEVKGYLNKFKSPILINYDKSLDYNHDIIESTKVKKVITLQSDEINRLLTRSEKDEIVEDQIINYSDLALIGKKHKGKLTSKLLPHEDALILFTSGTTGAPKAVVLTNKNILAAGTYLKNSTSIKPVHGEKSLVCVPFTYPYGFSTSTLMSLICAREVILAPDLSEDRLEYYYSKNPTIIFGSPALL